MYATRRGSLTCLCTCAFLCALAADPAVGASTRREAPRAAAPPVLEGVQVEFAGVVEPFTPVGLQDGGVDFELLESPQGDMPNWKAFVLGQAQLQPLEVSYLPDPELKGIGAWVRLATTRSPAQARRDVSVRFFDRAGQVAFALHYAGAVPTELNTADPSRITLVLAVESVEAESGNAPLLQPLQPRPESAEESDSGWGPGVRLDVVVEGVGEFAPRLVAGGEVTAAQAGAPGEVGSLRIYGGGIPIPVAGPIVTRALNGQSDRWNVHVNVLDRAGAVVSTTAFHDCVPVRYRPPSGDPAGAALLEEVLELKPSWTEIDDGQTTDAQQPAATPAGLPGVQAEVAGLTGPFSPVRVAGGGATAEVVEVTQGNDWEWRQFALGNIQVQPLEVTYPSTLELQSLGAWFEDGQRGSAVRRDVHVSFLDRAGQVASSLGYGDAFPAQLQAGPEATTLVLQVDSLEPELVAGALLQPLEPRPESAAEPATAWVGPRLAVEVEGLGQFTPRLVAGGEVTTADGQAATATGATAEQGVALKEVGSLRIYGGVDPIPVAGPIATSALHGEVTRWTVHARELDRSGNPFRITTFHDCLFVGYLPPASDPASGALLEEVLELKPTRVEIQ